MMTTTLSNNNNNNNNNNNVVDGNDKEVVVVESTMRMALHSNECISLLRQGVCIMEETANDMITNVTREEEIAAATSTKGTTTTTTTRNKASFFYDSEEETTSDEEEKSSSFSLENSSSSSSSSSEEEEENEDDETTQNEKADAQTTTRTRMKHKSKPKKTKTLTNQQKREQQMLIKKHVENIICISIPVKTNKNNTENNHSNNNNNNLDDNDDGFVFREVLNVPACLFPPHREMDDHFNASQYLLSTLKEEETTGDVPNKREGENYVIVLLLQSGRFAGGVFDYTAARQQQQHHHHRKGDSDHDHHSYYGHCIDHHTSQRYTIRKGQGKAQSSMDNSGRRPKSMGAQLRRYGEEQLKQDMMKILQSWERYIQQAQFIFIACPKLMKKDLFSILHPLGVLQSKQDPRVKKIPLDYGGKPTFQKVQMIHQVVMTVTLQTLRIRTTATTSTNIPTQQQQQQQSSEYNNNHNTTTVAEREQQQKEEQKTTIQPLPLSKLHLAAINGDLASIKECLDNEEKTDHCDDHENKIENQTDNDKQQQQQQQQQKQKQRMIDQLAGDDWMAPLHMAAESTNNKRNRNNNQDKDEDGNNNSNTVDPDVAADCVFHLLVHGKANPCMVDARNRVPYFLASHEKVLLAFRRARSVLGEDYCDWSMTGAKVGPPISEQEVQQRKEKQLDKKRNKRKKQKEKKKNEKLKQEELKRQQMEQEQQKAKEEEAKRIRDGLQPKTSSSLDKSRQIQCDFCHKIVAKRNKKNMFQRLQYMYCSTDCVQKHKRELMANAAVARMSNNNS